MAEATLSSADKAPESWDELRRRMNVTVLDEYGTETRREPAAMVSLAQAECVAVFDDDTDGTADCGVYVSQDDANLPPPPAASCYEAYCQAALRLCVAYRLLEVSEAAAEVRLRSGTSTDRVPPQATAARAAMSEAALVTAREASITALDALRDSAGRASTGATCAGADAVQGTASGTLPGDLDDLLWYEPDPEGVPTVGEAMGATATEAFWLVRQAAETTKRQQLAVADAAYSEHSSRSRANRYAYVAPVLSRGHVAELFLGTHKHDDFRDRQAITTLGDQPTCASRGRTPGVELALAAMRDSGVNPGEVLDDASWHIADLVEDGVTGGSVAARLRELYGDSVPQDDRIHEYLGTTREDFIQARSILQDEYRLFDRSLTQTIEGRRNADGQPAGFDYFASTTLAPRGAPEGRWLALTRAAPTVSSAPTTAVSHVGGRVTRSREYARSSVSAYLDHAYTVVRELLMDDGTVQTLVPGDAANALATIFTTGGDEQAGRYEASIYRYATGEHYSMHRVYTNASAVTIVKGTAGLECATEGTVEGQPCDVNDHELSVGSTLYGADREAGYPSYHRFFFSAHPSSPNTPPAGGRQTYHALSRAPGAPDAPGGYELIASVTIPDELPVYQYTNFVAVANDWAEGHAVDAIETHAKRCDEPETSCSGLDSEQLIPLENELSEDGDAFESSWRTYLGLARRAADEADELGQQLIREGLAMDQRAELALEELERQCGSAVDLDPFALLDPDSARDEIGGSCAGTSGCAENQVCQDGICALDPVARVLASPIDEDGPEESRLRACLGSPGADRLITLGSRHLCVYVNAANPNDICPEGGGDCPSFADTDMSGNPVCSGSPPTGYVNELVEPLHLFSSTESMAPGDHRENLPARAEVCDSFRRVRAGIGTNFDRLSVAGSAVFDPTSLQGIARSLAWHPEPYDFGTMRRGEDFWFGTGSLSIGPAGTWPCAAATNIDCTGDTTSLFCSTVTCGNAYQRAIMNDRMFSANLAARALTGASMKGLRWPIRAPDHYDINLDGRETNVPVALGVGPQLIRSANVLVECSGGADETHYEGSGALRAETYYPESYAPVLWQTFWRSDDGVFYHRPFDGDGPSRKVITFLTLDDGEQHGNSARAVGDFFAGVRGRRSTYFTGERPYRRFLDILMRPPASDEHFELTEEDLRGHFSARWNDPRDRCAVHRWGDGNLAHVAEQGLTRQNVLDAMELLCEAPVRRGSGIEVDPNCDPANPPVVETVDDLPRLRAYMACIADTIHQRGERMVFANVPEKVVEVLSDPGGVGVYPALGGEYAQSVTSLRDGFIGTQSNVPLIAFELRQFSEELRNLDLTMRSLEIRDDLAGLRLGSTIANQISTCAAQTAGAIGAGALSNQAGVAYAMCANSLIQIAIAIRSRALEAGLIEIEGETALSALSKAMDNRVRNLEGIMTSLRRAQENIDSGLAGLERVRRTGARAVAKATFADSDEAGRQYNVNTTMRRSFNTTNIRYQRAHRYAVRMAYLAKIALEQRLGMRLADIDRDMSLVDNPSEWHSLLCTASPIDYTEVRDGSAPITHYAESFIGDYVRRLEAVVESYRLDFPFSDATDTAVVSLRDDVFGSRTVCEQPSDNLLHHSSDLNRLSDGTSPGWQPADCADLGGGLVEDCVTAEPLAEESIPLRNSPGLGEPRPFRVLFGDPAGALAGDDWTIPGSFDPGITRWIQTFRAEPGHRYRVSWFVRATPHARPPIDVVGVHDMVGDGLLYARTEDVFTSARLDDGDPMTPDWQRFYGFFDHPGSAGGTVDVSILSQALSGTSKQQYVDIAGLMIEDVTRSVVEPALTLDGAGYPPRIYQDVGDALVVSGPLCEDTLGDEFRREHWSRVCEQRCPVGLESCDPEVAVAQCYWEAGFELTPGGIESGRLLGASGFAVGNYNYRVDRVALNVVGTAVRTCEGSDAPSACHAAGYVPYSIEHVGPFSVRNHLGATDYEAPLFDGRIVRGRALSSERYLSNPVSSADRALIEPFSHRELRGRPISGAYRIRIWDDGALDWSKVEDIQILLDYRYWTRLD